MWIGFNNPSLHYSSTLVFHNFCSGSSSLDHRKEQSTENLLLIFFCGVFYFCGLKSQFSSGLGTEDQVFFTGARMEDRLDYLFQEWHKLGGAVLLDKSDNITLSRTPEEIFAESTSYCRNSGRLTWIMIDWLISNINDIDEKKLIQKTKEKGDLSVLCLLCDLAQSRASNPKFDHIIRVCLPNNKLEVFFHRVARSPLARKLTKENALEIFFRWNFLCNEVRYLH